ncbi:hypothetical protein HBB16_00385 [Pseudonocardia sp. MCCB 268]|nr:hypothetical protein [Pseudonocardia cytotoxica]
MACTPARRAGGRPAGRRDDGVPRPDAPLDLRRVDASWRRLGRCSPGSTSRPAATSGSGRGPASTDGLLVGRTRTPGVHVAGGTAGVALGLLTGRLLAGQISARRDRIGAAPLSTRCGDWPGAAR